MTLKEYWKILNGHDWYYNYSDDQRVWRAGCDAQKRIEGIAKESPEHQALYSGFHSHYFYGKTSEFQKNDKRPPKPVRPFQVGERVKFIKNGSIGWECNDWASMDGLVVGDVYTVYHINNENPSVAVEEGNIKYDIHPDHFDWAE
jgi:hypothetical protein